MANKVGKTYLLNYRLAYKQKHGYSYGHKLVLKEKKCSQCKGLFTSSRDNSTMCSDKCRKNRVKTYNMSVRMKKKVDTLTHYCNGTPRCQCCSEDDIRFLSIDHIIPVAVSKKERFGLLDNLKKMGYPEGFQVLCFNCNFGKGVKNQCPHKVCNFG